MPPSAPSANGHHRTATSSSLRPRLAVAKRAPMWRQCIANRTRLQRLAIAVFAMATLALVIESATLGGSRVLRHSADWAQYAWHRLAREPAAASAPEPTPPPPSVFATANERMCYYMRDVGLMTELRAARKVFCEARPAAFDPARRTEVSLIDLAERGVTMRAMMFKRDLELDFTAATIHKPIASMAEDGGNHDPRFNWHAGLISCGCEDVRKHAAQLSAASRDNSTLRLWDPQLMNTPAEYDEDSTLCASTSVRDDSDAVEITEKTILIARKDDHNPFFQISNALNAWLLMRTFGWKREETRVVHMDGGYTSPIDALHHRLLSSPEKYEILRGREDLVGRRFKFINDVIVAPYEVSGPMMQHLNNREPCHASHLFHEFRRQSLAAMDVDADALDTSRQITVTIITRRNYGGRRVQRKWLNEDHVLAAMREKYSNHNGVPIVIQSVDFVGLSLQEQMQVALTSDVIIGMHGAGMVNVLWTKPETLVVEIFPRRRWRWGYRNICQFIGCDWHQFRGGNDTGRGDNRSDKTIPVDVWNAFFDPLFGEYLSKLTATKQQPFVVDQQPQRLRR